MGDFKRDMKILVITEDGFIQPLGNITKLESAVCRSDWDWDSILKIGKVTQSIKTDISGTNVNIEDIPTYMLEAAKKKLENIIDDRKIREMLISVPSFSKMFEHCNLPTAIETKKTYIGAARASGKSLRASEQIKKVTVDELGCTGGCHLPDNELLEYCKNDVDLCERLIKFLENSTYGKNGDKRIFLSARGSGKTLMSRKWYEESLMGTRKISRLLDNVDANKIWINEKKKVVTVKKPDGSVIKVKCDQRDEFDPYVGTALALAYKEFGSKSKFRKYVDEIVAKQKKENKK